MKKIRREKPIGIIIHIYMDISQGSYLCGYLYFKQAKMSVFFFFLHKSKEQETEQVLSKSGYWYQWEGIPVESMPGMERGGLGRKVERVNSSMKYFIHFKNFCK
jgi:hypothetical protein